MKMAMEKQGMITFLASEAVFFVFLIISYLNFFHLSQPDAKRLLDLKRTGIFTACLIASSGTMELATIYARRIDLKRFRVWLILTVILGGIFIYGQLTEYVYLFKQSIDIGRNLFSTTFYTLTGFHSLHLISGLVMLLILWDRSWIIPSQNGNAPGVIQDRRPIGVESIALYWHFVDFVWIFIFSLIYLGSFLM